MSGYVHSVPRVRVCVCVVYVFGRAVVSLLHAFEWNILRLPFCAWDPMLVILECRADMGCSFICRH